MKYIDIEVTREDISKGVRGSSISCPLARAAERKFPLADISASTYSIHIGKEGYRYSNLLTIQVNNFDVFGVFIPRTYRIFKEEE